MKEGSPSGNAASLKGSNANEYSGAAPGGGPHHPAHLLPPGAPGLAGPAPAPTFKAAATAAAAKVTSSSPSQRSCNCRKSGCFKLYCDCLRAGFLCNEHCKCTHCKNRVPNEQRDKLLNLVKAKVDFASPARGAGPATPSRGCGCKKSGCSKNYCECFQQGVPCTTSCSCNVSCKNNKLTALMSESDAASSPQRPGMQGMLQDYDKESNSNGQPLTSTDRDRLSVARQEEISFINQPFRNIDSESKSRGPQPIYDDGTFTPRQRSN